MKNKENYLLIGGIIFFVILIGFVYGYYEKKIVEERERLEILREKISLIEQLNELRKNWQEKANIYLAKSLFSLKEDIKNKANSKNIRIEKWQILSFQKKDVICEYEIKVRLDGDYDDFIKFIKEVEKIPFIKIQDLFIKKGEMDNLKVELKFITEAES